MMENTDVLLNGNMKLTMTGSNNIYINFEVNYMHLK